MNDFNRDIQIIIQFFLSVRANPVIRSNRVKHSSHYRNKRKHNGK
jgi:hypothetical protein